MQKETKNKLLIGSAAIVGGAITHGALEAGWKAVKKEDPPKNPESRSTNWKDAITWTLSAAVIAGLTKLAIRKGMVNKLNS